MIARCLIGLCLGLVWHLAQADSAGQDAVNWLARMAMAAQKLNYTGVFVYQSAERTETSRIVHVVDGAGERERLESLDGSPREVLREGGEVRCYLPAEKMVLLERERAAKTFPANLPASLASITESYEISKGETARVAGLDSQQVLLIPKDTYRYGHQLWADRNTGLLLRSRMVDARQNMLEQFSFTQIQIGGTFDPAALKSRLAVESGQWRVHDVRGGEDVTDLRGLQFRNAPPGFKRSAAMKRLNTAKTAEVIQVVFSDGMAAMSVFIEPLAKEKSEAGLFSVGATNIYKRVVGERLVTVVGEVPAQTLKRLGDGVEFR